MVGLKKSKKEENGEKSNIVYKLQKWSKKTPNQKCQRMEAFNP